MPPPTITNLSVNEGPQAGGTTLVVTGTNLDTATDLDFLDAGTTPLSFSVDGPTQLTVASMPAHAKAIGVILVTNPSGNAISSDTYAYDDSSTDPRVTGMTPDNGPSAGGTSVAIHGERFTGASAVDFGFTPATSFSVDSDTLITAEAPAHFAAGVYVKVTNGGETNPNGLPNVYGYFDPPPDPPVIDSVTPSAGFVGGGTTVHVVGSNFGGTYDVQIDGVSVGYSQFDNEHIDLTTEPHVAGTGFLLAVFCDGGEADATFDFVETPDPEPEPPLAGPCITVEVPGFLADGSTPDGDGIVYTPQLVGGWFDSIPLRSATSEIQPRGQHVTVAQELGRDVELVIVAHAPGGRTALGSVLCFTAMETIKAAFRILFVPVSLRVVDPSADRSANARRVGSIRQAIVGEFVEVKSSIPLLCPDPRRFPT